MVGFQVKSLRHVAIAFLADEGPMTRDEFVTGLVALDISEDVIESVLRDCGKHEYTKRCIHLTPKGREMLEATEARQGAAGASGQSSTPNAEMGASHVS